MASGMSEFFKEFEKKNVIVLFDNSDQEYFPGKQVAEILEYQNVKDALYKYVESEDKIYLGDLEKDNPGIRDEILKEYNRDNSVYITLSGLFDLVSKSEMPLAKSFQRWVTHDLLPSLRKNRVYYLSKKEEFADVKNYCCQLDERGDWQDNLHLHFKPETEEVVDSAKDIGKREKYRRSPKIKCDSVERERKELSCFRSQREKDKESIIRYQKEALEYKDEIIKAKNETIKARKDFTAIEERLTNVEKSLSNLFLNK